MTQLLSKIRQILNESHWTRPTEKPKKGIEAYHAGYRHGARHRDHGVWRLHADYELENHNPYHHNKEKKLHKEWRRGYADSEYEYV